MNEYMKWNIRLNERNRDRIKNRIMMMNEALLRENSRFFKSSATHIAV